MTKPFKTTKEIVEGIEFRIGMLKETYKTLMQEGFLQSQRLMMERVDASIDELETLLDWIKNEEKNE